jgi:O-antigen/teichoic acid export membrane protein
VDVLGSTEAGGRFIRGSGIRVAAYGAGLAVGLAATPFVVRHLQPVGWGRFVTVTSLIFIVAALTEGGLANLGIREFSTADDAERRAYMQALLGLRIALTVVGGAAAVLFTVVAGYDEVLVEGTAVACVGLLLMNLQVTLAVPLTAGLRLGGVAAIDLLAQTVTAVAMITLVLLGASLLPFYAVSAVTGLTTLTLTTALVRRQLTLRPTFALDRWGHLLSESIVYAAATALGVVYFRIVVITVNPLSDATQSGYFGLGFRILDLANAVPWLLVTSAFPILARAARDDAERLRYALQRLFEMGLIVGGWMSLGLIVGAPFAVAVVGGSQFDPSVDVLRILGSGVAATFLVATWGFALLSLKRYRELIVVNGLIVLFAIALCVTLIPAYGAHGAAIVTVTLEVSLASGYAFALMRHRPDLRPRLGQAPRITLALAIAFAVGLAVPWHPVVGVVLGSAALVAGLQLLGALPAELAQALFRRHG